MGEVVSVFLYRLQFPSYDIISDVIMSDADCTPGREPRSIAASFVISCDNVTAVGSLKGVVCLPSEVS